MKRSCHLMLQRLWGDSNNVPTKEKIEVVAIEDRNQNQNFKAVGKSFYLFNEKKRQLCIVWRKWKPRCVGRYVYGEQLKKFYSEGRNYVTRRRWDHDGTHIFICLINCGGRNENSQLSVTRVVAVCGIISKNLIKFQLTKQCPSIKAATNKHAYLLWFEDLAVRSIFKSDSRGESGY